MPETAQPAKAPENSEQASELQDRKGEAEYLYSEAGDVLARMETVEDGLGTDPDIEKFDQMEKAVKAAESIQRALEGNDEPSDAILEKLRETLKEAQMRANEAEPAFPQRRT